MQPADPHTLDRPWRIWASVVIVGALAFSVVFGFVVLPVVQGYAAGVDPFTAMCRALGILPGSPAVPQPVSQAEAQPTTQVAWSIELLRALDRPGPAGVEVAEMCAACHGDAGISPDPANPNLAGQSAVALFKQLHDYKSGSRVNELMTPIAQSLDDQQITEVAAHFAAANRRALDPTTAAVVDDDIVQLVERGDASRGLPACNSCHSPTAGGPIETPTLARQNRDYLAAQLRAYRSGERRNDIYTRMRSIAAKLSDREIDRLSAYYATTLRQ